MKTKVADNEVSGECNLDWKNPKGDTLTMAATWLPVFQFHTMIVPLIIGGDTCE